MITPIICVNKSIVCSCTPILVSAIIVVCNEIIKEGAMNNYFKKMK
jgi:hypothetical protein